MPPPNPSRNDGARLPTAPLPCDALDDPQMRQLDCSVRAEMSPCG